ncbi:hypothetical protein J4223_00795 [Candidatus Woesearchaeota archaeon]|nr:hypothetical protein [Candidatus Woesearchaeota archaeon]
MRIKDIYDKCLELELETGDSIELITNGKSIKGVLESAILDQKGYTFSYVNLEPVTVIFEYRKDSDELPYRGIDRWEPSDEFDKLVVSKIKEDLSKGTSRYRH